MSLRQTALNGTVIAVMLVAACGPAATVDPTAPPAPTVAPTVQPPTEPPAPTPLPTVFQPTAAPPVVRDTASHATTRELLSLEFPGQWYGPAQLPFDDGLYVKDPDLPIGVIMRLLPGGEPAALLAGWDGDVSVVALLEFTASTIADGDSVTISRIEAPTEVGQGDDLTVQIAYVKRPKDVMEVIWFAPNDRWEEMQTALAGVVDSIEIWTKYQTSYSLQTMYLHDWPSPEASPLGEGTWLHSPDGKTGVLIGLQPIADPVGLLAAWDAVPLSEVGLMDCTAEEATGQTRALGGEWESRTGDCKDADGTAATYVVLYAPDRDRVLEIVGYGPSDDWEYARGIVETMLSMLTDFRP